MINHAWLGEQIEAALGDGSDYGVHITYSPECEKGLETAGGIANALPLLGDAPFLVVNGDIFTDYPFQQLREVDLSQDRLAHLVMIDNPDHHIAGDWGMVGGLASKAAQSYYTFSGIGLYHPTLFAHTAVGKKAKLLPLFLAAMQAEKISAEYYTGRWFDVGTIERLAIANEMAMHLFL